MFSVIYDYKLIVLLVGFYETEVIAEEKFETREKAEEKARYYKEHHPMTTHGRFITIVIDL